MQICARSATFTVLLTLGFTGAAASSVFHRGRKPSESSQVTIQAGTPGCSVDIDGTAQGKTGAGGALTVKDVSPSDHYVHVDCPGQTEMTYFVSPEPGATAQVQTQSAPSAGADDATPLGEAESKTELRRLVNVAADDRADGQFPEAVQTLRQAIQLDSGNPGLHHELGMTFLMIRDWDRAAVEFREAVRLDPASAGAHNGLGYALEKMDDLPEAVKQFRTATQLDPSDGSYRDHYVEALGMLSSEQAGRKKKRR